MQQKAAGAVQAAEMQKRVPGWQASVLDSAHGDPTATSTVICH